MFVSSIIVRLDVRIVLLSHRLINERNTLSTERAYVVLMIIMSKDRIDKYVMRAAVHELAKQFCSTIYFKSKA